MRRQKIGISRAGPGDRQDGNDPSTAPEHAQNMAAHQLLARVLTASAGKTHLGGLTLSPGSTARQLSPTGPRQSPTVPTGVNRQSRHAPTALYHKARQ